jgi:hypothetical protein
VEVAGAVLGLTAVDLVAVVQGPAVVGDQGQGGGQALRLEAQRPGHVGDQTTVEAPLQFVLPGQGGVQGLAEGLGGGDGQQARGRGEDGGQLRRGRKEDGQEHAGGAAVAVVGQLQTAGEQAGGVDLDPRVGQRIPRYASLLPGMTS